MKLWRRNPHTYQAPIGNTPDERLKQEALHQLVGLYPAEYVKHATKRFDALPNGGSRLPWRYRKQILQALDDADDDLIASHPIEWKALTDVLRMKDITPEDIIHPDTP